MFKVGELVKIELVGNNFQKEMALIFGLTFRAFCLFVLFSVPSLLHPVHLGKNFNLGYFQIPLRGEFCDWEIIY